MIYKSPSSENTLKMRADALESNIFFENIPNQHPHVLKYYPPSRMQSDWSIAPKYASPVLPGYINKITAMAYEKIRVQMPTEEMNQLAYRFIEDNGGSDLFLNILVNSLVGGNYLITISKEDDFIKFNDWKAELIGRFAPESYYIEYLLEDGIAMPVLSKEVTHTNKVTPVLIPINNMQVGDVKHELGFTPAVFIRNIDKYPDRSYGRAYVYRFLNVLKEYNLTLSQMARAIRIFQNTWITNKEVDDPNKPLRIQPDMINFLGEKGTLEQIKKELDLEEEREQCRIYRDDLATASQIPTFMAGYDNVTKLESGIALQMAFKPLEELMGRVRENFINNLKQLLNKSFKIYYNTQNDFDVNVHLSIPKIINDKSKEIASIQSLVKDGLLTPEEARNLILPFFGLEE